MVRIKIKLREQPNIDAIARNILDKCSQTDRQFITLQDVKDALTHIYFYGKAKSRV